MFNETYDSERLSAFRKLAFQNITLELPQFDKLFMANEMLAVINSQNGLIVKLLNRQSQLTVELEKLNQNTNTSSGSENKEASPPYKVSGYRELTQQEQFCSGATQEKDPHPAKNNVEIIAGKGSAIIIHGQPPKSEEYSYNADMEIDDISDVKGSKNSKKRQTQTKNMVKNFSKSIFLFIRKNTSKRLSILNYLSIKDQDFMKIFEDLRGNIHSITELRNLWTPEGNVYHKAFRILSYQYLRKECFNRTFNSRVENYTLHLKYRKRLMDSLKSPQQFTVLKTN